MYILYIYGWSGLVNIIIIINRENSVRLTRYIHTVGCRYIQYTIHLYIQTIHKYIQINI